MILWARSVTRIAFEGKLPFAEPRVIAEGLPDASTVELAAVMTPERWESLCMQCGRVIHPDGQCGCAWRRLPIWLQALVLNVLPMGTFR